MISYATVVCLKKPELDIKCPPGATIVGAERKVLVFSPPRLLEVVFQSEESILQQTNLLHLHLFAIPTSTLKLLHYFYTNLNSENFEKILKENRNFGKNRENQMSEIIIGQGRPPLLGVAL